MAQDLTGKVALVTGGSDGIGFATAALLARRGAQVVICGRRPEQLEAARARIAGEGGAIESHVLDVTDFPAFEALIEDIAARHGRLDMLVSRALLLPSGPGTVEARTLESVRVSSPL